MDRKYSQDKTELKYDDNSYTLNNINNDNSSTKANSTFNGKSALEYVKYLLNDSKMNDKINYSELREELDASTFGGTLHKSAFKNKNEKEINYDYFEDLKDKNNSKEFEEILNKIERYKKDIDELKNELEETNNKNKILEEENTQLKLLLSETNLANEKDNSLNEGSDMDIQLKLNPEQQITLEKLQELMIQLSKKIEKLKNDNEALKQKVISSNEDANEINVINTSKVLSIIKTKSKNKCETEKFIDILTDEECRHVLFYICSHLKINDFTNIDTNLRNVEITIKSVPQMQKFISEVDDLVWKTKDEDNSIHKLSETLNEIKKLIKK